MDAMRIVISVFAFLLEGEFIEVIKRTDNIEVAEIEGAYAIFFNPVDRNEQHERVTRSIQKMALTIHNINRVAQKKGEPPIEMNYDRENHILTLPLTQKQREELKEAFPEAKA